MLPSNVAGENATPVRESSSRALDVIFGPLVIADNVSAVRHRAAALPLEERFRYLLEIVFPSEMHTSVRVAGEFTGTSPSPVELGLSADQSCDGGELISPVFDLLDVATELERMDELRRRVSTLPQPQNQHERRCQTALRALVSLELRDMAALDDSIDELLTQFANSTVPHVDADIPAAIVAHRAFAVLPDRAAVGNLLQEMSVGELRNVPGPAADVRRDKIANLYRQFRHRELRHSLQPIQSASNNVWTPASRQSTQSCGGGATNAEWLRSDDGTIFLSSSHDEDCLFYRSPLLGNFEVEGTLGPGGKPQFLGRGTWIGPAVGTSRLAVGSFRQGQTSWLEPEPKMVRFDPEIRFRAVFRDESVDYFINGRWVHRSLQPAHHDPWIALHRLRRHDAEFREIRISGTPTIPDVVQLSASEDLSGWLQYHRPNDQAQSADWNYVATVDGGEIVGKRQPNLSGSHAESLLRYQRPLVEDGSIEFDFYHKRGAAEVHPALDRLVFLLNSDEVRLHWVTDGPFDRSSVPPDNSFQSHDNTITGNGVPLRDDAWNHLELRLAGDVVTLELNDQPILTHQLERNNARTFGLFHYSDKSMARVRNVAMRGDWPKSVAPEMTPGDTGSPADVLDADLPSLTSVFAHDFVANGLPEEYFTSWTSGDGGQITSGADGISVMRPGIGKWATAEVTLPFIIHGDFDIEATFDEADIHGDKFSEVVISVDLDDEKKSLCRMTRQGGDAHEPTQHLFPFYSWIQRDDSRSYAANPRTACEATSGRLRLARRGEVVSYLFAEADSDVFRVIATETASDKLTLPKGIRLRALTTGNGACSVVWKNIVLRAERMTIVPAGGPRRRLFVADAEFKDIKPIADPAAGFFVVGSGEWSSDGRKIAFDMSSGGTETSRVMIIDPNGENLKDLGPGCMPSLSADGSEVVFTESGVGIVRMNVDGTERKLLDSRGWGTQWSPDGKYIAWASGSNLTLLNVATDERRSMFAPDQGRNLGYIRWNFGWSHDSRSIAFKTTLSSPNGDALVAVNVTSPGTIDVLYQGPGINEDFTWSPDGQRVLFTTHESVSGTRQLYTAQCDSDAPPQLIPGQPLDWKIFDCDWSPDGKHIVFSALSPLEPVEWITKNDPSLTVNPE